MKIAIFSDTFFPEINGVVTFQMNIIKFLGKDNKIIFFVPNYPKKIDNKKWKEIKQKNITIKRYGSIALTSNPTTRIALTLGLSMKKEIMKFKPDIIHVQTLGPIGFIGAAIAKKLKIPSIGTYHTFYSEFAFKYLSPIKLLKLDYIYTKYIYQNLNGTKNLFQRIKRFFQRKKKVDKLKIYKRRRYSRLTRYPMAMVKGSFSIIKFPFKAITKGSTTTRKYLNDSIVWDIAKRFHNSFDLNTAPSEYMAKLLERKGVERPVIFISNGINLDKFEYKPKKLERTNIELLHVGRMGPEKNVSILLHMMKELNKNKKYSFTLRIIGSGPELKNLRIQAKSMNLDNVIFEGSKPRDELVKYYQNADIFVTASPIETQGIVVLEAFACGTPVVGANKLALKDLIKDGYNGFKAKPKDPKDYAKKVIKILKSKYDVMCSNARKSAEEHDLTRSMMKFRDLYEDLSEFSKVIKNYADKK